MGVRGKSGGVGWRLEIVQTVGSQEPGSREGGGGSGFHRKTKRLTESRGLDQFRHGPPLGSGGGDPGGLEGQALSGWGYFSQPLEKQRTDRVVKQKQRRPGST